jgi:hypothetical protein
MRAPAIAAALSPLYWPVHLGTVRALLARGGICRSTAFRAAYTAYARRHNAAISQPRAPSSRFLVYNICCGQLGNRIQALVASFVMAMVSGRTLLVSWPAVSGLSNETVADLFETPKGLTGWEAAPVLASFSQKEMQQEVRRATLLDHDPSPPWQAGSQAAARARYQYCEYCATMRAICWSPSCYRRCRCRCACACMEGGPVRASP